MNRRTALFTLMIMLTSLVTVHAQTGKGRWMVGAEVGNFRYSSQNGGSSFLGSIAPSAGYFFVDNFVVGTGVPISYGVSENGTVYKNAAFSVGLSPFIRYYFGAAALKPYAGLSYSYSHNWRTNKVPARTLTVDGYSSTIAPTAGVAYFIGQTVALNAGLSYVSEEYVNEDFRYTFGTPVLVKSRSKYTYLSLGVGFQLFFGK